MTVPATPLPPAALKAALTYSVQHRGEALLVWQNNQTVLEEYRGDGSRDEPHRIFSGTKGFWAFAALAAEEDGLWQLDERVSDTIPAWKNDARKAVITLRDLLNFNSGLEPDFHLHSPSVDNRNVRAVQDRMVASRGEAFIYGPSALQVLHEVFKRKLVAWNESPTAYLERRVLQPLGLGLQRYVPDGRGNPLLASGFLLTARQWAGLGRCLLQKGRPILISDRLTLVLRGTEANPAFSFGFWNNHLAASPAAREMDVEETLELDWPKQNWRQAVLCRSAPADLIVGLGSSGQRLYVVPSRALVVVRLARDSKFKDSEFLERLFRP
jgi:CubicO group peptidase (beta-lactamase class C family)